MATTMDPITSDQPKLSPSQSAAMATPKGGDRKWKAAALTAPMRVTSLRLLSEAGEEMQLRREGATKDMVQQVRAAVPRPLAPGAYRVEWRGASPDGHVGGGTLRFRVGPAAR